MLQSESAHVFHGKIFAVLWKTFVAIDFYTIEFTKYCYGKNYIPTWKFLTIKNFCAMEKHDRSGLYVFGKFMLMLYGTCHALWNQSHAIEPLMLYGNLK